MVALYRGALPVAQFLVDKGAQTDSRDINGLSLLHHAVDSGQPDSVQFALDAGADIDLQDCSGWTPLIRAAIHGHAHIAALLLARGAERGRRDAHGLDYARHRQLSGAPC
ncbi:ankyrin repeat domain-containing protein 65-like [Dendroctonus ponderosae]|uniref:ankyrin repeat domain-containing protein 65-like n=1 Tax=Dendroctonus ponderosae TaxID=77166 RepID=UPI0020363229|nr:ankyrin repeat domain-containing protein 65-like [Dendroctonus ponderosae]